MLDSPTAEPLLTAEDLYGLPEDDRRYELVEGRLVVSEPPGWTHGGIAAQIAAALMPFVRAHRLGQVVVESGYVHARRPDTVRGPDVSFVRADRLPAREVAYPDLHSVVVHAPDGLARLHGPEDILDGGDVLPDLAIAVAELFPD
ncbi:MAG: Uma2 family endonuclease [Gemmatirosa sp.]